VSPNHKFLRNLVVSPGIELAEIVCVDQKEAAFFTQGDGQIGALRKVRWQQGDACGAKFQIVEVNTGLIVRGKPNPGPFVAPRVAYEGVAVPGWVACKVARIASNSSLLSAEKLGPPRGGPSFLIADR
jgi:hypothetical protein